MTSAKTGRARQSAIKWVDANAARLRAFGSWFLFPPLEDDGTLGTIRSSVRNSPTWACPISALYPYRGGHDPYPMGGWDDDEPDLEGLPVAAAFLIQQAADGLLPESDSVLVALMSALEPERKE